MNPGIVILIGCVLGLPGAFASEESNVEQLNWISGHWCSDSDDGRVEEIWLPVHGQMMVGMSRTLAGDRTSSFEYLRIVMEDQGPAYVAQPGGHPPVSFLRIDGGKNWVRFANPEHDFPQHIEYRRDDDTLRAKIAGPVKDGNEFEILFAYVPC
jgi:hypothetical protein